MGVTALSRDRASPGVMAAQQHWPASSASAPSLWEEAPAPHKPCCLPGSSPCLLGRRQENRMRERTGQCARHWAQDASRVGPALAAWCSWRQPWCFCHTTSHHKESRWKEHSKHSPSQITEPVNHYYFMSWKAEVVVLALRGILCLFWVFSPKQDTACYCQDSQHSLWLKAVQQSFWFH